MNFAGREMAIREFVRTQIIPKAKAGKALVITLRAQDHWGVDHTPRKRLISGPNSFNRGAYFIQGGIAERELARQLRIQNELLKVTA